MAETIKTYVSDGSTTIYTFDFDYISADFVKVLVDGVEVTRTLSGTYQVTLDAAPDAGAVIIIKRVTDTGRIVDFVDGSILVAKDLNISALQAIHIAAEALSEATGSLLIDETGAYSAGGRRITLVGDPTGDADVATKGWIETSTSSVVAQSLAAAADAVLSKDAAAVHVTEAETAKTGAETARTGAETAETNAETAEDGAETARDLALAYANAAASSATDAATAETNAETAETNAAASAAAAAQSATNAAVFDPTAYVEKAGDSMTGDLSVGGNISVTGTVDGRDIAADGGKLDTLDVLPLVDDDTFASATSTNVPSAESVKAYVDNKPGGGLPSGAVFWFAASSAPADYLECDGAAVSRTTYADLFAVVGTTFGAGDGSTTFNLPDLRGEFVRGWDNGRGVDSGRSFGSSQTDEFKSHTHGVGSEYAAGSGYGVNPQASNNTSSPVYVNTKSTGGSETRPRNIALLPCIKT